MSLSKCANPNIATTAFQKFYLNDSMADVYFTVGTERFPSHKFMLATLSDAFEAMFSGSWKSGDIKIENASVASFKIFLKFFYYETIELTMDNIEDVMRLGQMYLVTGCLDVCAQFLTKNLTNDLVCFIYGLSIIFDLAELKRICEVSIDLNAKEIFKTDGFLECDRQVLGHILTLQSLSCTEIEVFEACMDLVKSASKQSNLTNDLISIHLGALFYEIRFGAMTPDEQKRIFSLYGEVFTAELRSKISDLINSKAIENCPRQCSWNEATLLKCSRKLFDMRHKPYNLRNAEIITFTTNVPLLLRAVVGDKLYYQDYDSDYGEHDYELMTDGEDEYCELSVIEYFGDPKSDIDDEKSRVIYTDDAVIAKTMQLTKPVIIRPGFTYEVHIISGLENLEYPMCTDYIAQDGKVEVKEGIVVQFSSESTRKSDQNGFGFIVGLQFNEIYIRKN